SVRRRERTWLALQPAISPSEASWGPSVGSPDHLDLPSRGMAGLQRPGRVGAHHRPQPVGGRGARAAEPVAVREPTVAQTGRGERLPALALANLQLDELARRRWGPDHLARQPDGLAVDHALGAGREADRGSDLHGGAAVARVVAVREPQPVAEGDDP